MALTGVSRLVNTLTALYVAAGLAIAVSLLLLVTGLQNPDGFDYGPAWFVYLSVAFIFYAALAIGASRISRTPAKRRWLVACTVGSGMIAVFGGGVLSLLVFAPSTVILLWLAARG